jgi:alkylhydroperoxidase/carboxymuconolactone decarboxylase family protein YurZ
MSNTTRAKHRKARLRAGALVVALGLVTTLSQTADAQTRQITQSPASAPSVSETLNARQQAIVPIAAFAAAGNMAKLNAALNQGLDAGMTVSDVGEILVQLYAYAGFPRSLNALGELMKALEARKERGIPGCAGPCA